MSKVWTIKKENDKIKFSDGKNAIGLHKMGVGRVEISEDEIIRYSSNGNVKYYFYMRGNGEYRLGADFAHKVTSPQNELEKFLQKNWISKKIVKIENRKINKEVIEVSPDYSHGAFETGIEFFHNGDEEILETKGGDPHPNNSYAHTSIYQKIKITNADYLIEILKNYNGRRGAKKSIKSIIIYRDFNNYQKIVNLLQEVIKEEKL